VQLIDGKLKALDVMIEIRGVQERVRDRLRDRSLRQVNGKGGEREIEREREELPSAPSLG
jgi:hypothetical protein